MNATKPRRLPYERYRGGTLIKERWPDQKTAKAAFLTGQGLTSSAIAEALGDGTISATVRAMWKKWGLPYDARNADFVVPMGKATQTLLAKRAAAVGLTPEQWCANVISAVIQDDLYNAVVTETARCKKPGRLKP